MSGRVGNGRNWRKRRLQRRTSRRKMRQRRYARRSGRRLSERVHQLFPYFRSGRMNGGKIRSRIFERRMARGRHRTLTDELVRTRANAHIKSPSEGIGGAFYASRLDLLYRRDSYVHLLNSTVRTGERDFRDVVLERYDHAFAELRMADAASKVKIRRIVFHRMAGGSLV